MDDASFSNYLDKFIAKLTPQLSAERQDSFKKNVDPALKWLKSKVKDLKLYESEVVILSALYKFLGICL